MQESSQPGQEHISSGHIERLDVASAGRRRALLKGLGKGAGVLAAAVPLKSMAVVNTTCQAVDKNNKTVTILCSGSGMNSFAHSFGTASSTLPKSGGFSPSIYAGYGIDDTRWPACASNLSNAIGFGTVKVCSSSSPTTVLSVKQVLKASTVSANSKFGTAASLAELQHWLAAYLNVKGAGFNYPYTQAELAAIFTSSDTVLRGNVYSLLVNSLEKPA